MSDEPNLPIVGPWATEKLDRLAKYLRVYTTILTAPKQAKWCKGIVYFDAFAGAGRAVIRASTNASEPTAALFDRDADPIGAADRREVIDGSPRVALSTVPSFTHYVFIERDAARAAQLTALAAELGNSQRVRVVSEVDCNVYLEDRLIQRPRVNWREWRAIVFLDPFGMHVPWSTISGLGATKAVEVFINFPVGMAIQRLLKRSGAFTENERAKLDRYFGSPDWHAQLYEKKPTLFGDVDEKVALSGDRLVTWYRDRLQDAFGYVSAPHLIRNSRGGHLYYLIHAGPNAKGADIASAVLGDERVGKS